MNYSLSLGKFSIILILVLAPGAAMAQCLYSESPPDYWDQGSDPLFPDFCPDLFVGQHPPGGLPCPRPQAPTLELPTHAQEATVSIQVLQWGDPPRVARAIWWKASYLTNGVWNDLWTYRSVQGIGPNGAAAGTILRFGVPGLVQNLQGSPTPPVANYVQAAIEWTDGTQTCMSDRRRIYTPDFETTGPTPPVPLLIEDQFKRPPTDPSCGSEIGDGLGPHATAESSDAVYKDCFQISGENHTAAIRIAPDEDDAQASWASLFRYEARDDTDATGWRSHSYADALVRASMQPAAFPYNLQIHARWAGDYPETKSYVAKLTKGPRGCTGSHPALFVLQFPLEDDEWNPTGAYGLGRCDADRDSDGTPDPPLDQWGNPAGVICDENVPLDVEDGTSGMSKPVWLRIEVLPDFVSPTVVATAVWYEGSTQHSCTHSRTFYQDPGDMNGVRHGKWGMSFHERTYFIDIFRAGAEFAE
ncbi:MAG: hypothetical protein KBD01_20135 [Acidobacteria bacterium]|nr:hypothetical protein [Acidobacteriota bacterium]